MEFNTYYYLVFFTPNSYVPLQESAEPLLYPTQCSSTEYFHIAIAMNMSESVIRNIGLVGRKGRESSVDHMVASHLAPNSRAPLRPILGYVKKAPENL